MARYLILGAGKFGRLALERLSLCDPAPSFIIVDRAPEALGRIPLDEGVVRVEADAALFLAENLHEDPPWDWLIPMAPVHLAWVWLLAGPLAGQGWETVPLPEALLRLVPTAQRGVAGEVYLSRARELCPDNCPEPEDLCPVSGEPRAIPLYGELAALQVPGFLVRVISSRQLAPGVGGYQPQALLDLAREVADCPGPVLLATACRCHGVAHGLARPAKV